MKKEGLTYDLICFSELAHEWDSSRKEEIEKRIRRRLKYYDLDNYNEEKVDYIRVLRNELFEELSLKNKSKYYIETNSHYVGLKDFDVERMKIDYLEKYNRLNVGDLLKILNFAIHVFYLR
jgi:hypothetical protein